jgi:hypothetical protein
MPDRAMPGPRFATVARLGFQLALVHGCAAEAIVLTAQPAPDAVIDELSRTQFDAYCAAAIARSKTRYTPSEVHHAECMRMALRDTTLDLPFAVEVCSDHYEACLQDTVPEDPPAGCLEQAPRACGLTVGEWRSCQDALVEQDLGALVEARCADLPNVPPQVRYVAGSVPLPPDCEPLHDKCMAGNPGVFLGAAGSGP